MGTTWMGGHPSCTRLRSNHLYLLSFLKQNLGLFLTGFILHLPYPRGHFYKSWFLCPEDHWSLSTGLSVWTLPFELPLNYCWGPQPPGSLLGGVSKEGPNTEWPGNSLSFKEQPYLESLKGSLKKGERMCWIQKRRPRGTCFQPGKQPSGQLPLCVLTGLSNKEPYQQQNICQPVQGRGQRMGSWRMKGSHGKPGSPRQSAETYLSLLSCMLFLQCLHFPPPFCFLKQIKCLSNGPL